jgi:hypothetical protein
MMKAQLGTAVEVTYGTPVTPERFYEFLPGESLDRQQEVIQSAAIRPGIRSALGSRRSLVRQWGAGQITMEVATTTFGRWFEHMLGGTGAVTNPGTLAYLHTYTPGDLKGKSLTVQKAAEKNDETAQAFTFHGCKITDWEISISRSGLAILAVTLDAEDVDDTTSLASSSYGTLTPFTFAQATLSKDSSPVAGVSDCRIFGRNALNTERFFLGTSGVKSEPLANGLRELGGQLTAEFADLTTFHDAFEADTSMELELKFEGADIEASYPFELIVTLHDVRLTGETPKADVGPVEVSVPFEAYEDDSGDSVTIEYQTTDTAV